MDSNDITHKTIDLLTEHLAKFSSENPKWIFPVHHCIRVENIVRQILAGEPPLPAQNRLTLRMAAILHDIGNFDDRQNHAEVGARLVEDLLETTGAFLKEHVSPSLLVSLIRYHSRGIDVPIGTELAILRDADNLDQVGAMSILEEANQGDYMEPDFYSDKVTRLSSETLNECDAIAPYLFTPTAKKLLVEKRLFITNFIQQLEEELGEALEFQRQHIR
jgi:uncharacterized protein